MFHRIKSESQNAIPTQEKSDSQPITETVSEKEAKSSAAAPSIQPKNNTSPIEHYVSQQANLDRLREKSLPEKQEQSEAEPQGYQKEHSNVSIDNKSQEKELETMSTTTEATENQAQESGSSYTTSSSVTGGYPGSYGGPAYSAPSASESSSQEKGGRLVIGSGITMSGEIESCPHLVVEGTVEASLRGAEILEVSQGGVFFGTVEIAEATISGRFEGDITVTGRLSVTETGQVTGSITYGQLEMKAGAVIDGKITPANNRPAAKAQKTTRATSASKTKKETETASASNDAQLFPESVVAAE